MSRNGITFQLFRGPEATRLPRVKRGQTEHLKRPMESAEASGPGSRYEALLSIGRAVPCCCLTSHSLCADIQHGSPASSFLCGDAPVPMSSVPLWFLQLAPWLSSSEATLLSPSYSIYPDPSRELTCYICPVSACMAALLTWVTQTGIPAVTC